MRVNGILVIFIMIIVFGISRAASLCQFENSFTIELWINEDEKNKYSDYSLKLKVLKPRENSHYFNSISCYLDTLSNNVESYKMLLWTQSDTIFTCIQNSYMENDLERIINSSEEFIGVYRWSDKPWIFIYDRSGGNQEIKNYLEKEFVDMGSADFNIKYNIYPEKVYFAYFDGMMGLYGKYIDTVFYPIVFIPTPERFTDFIKDKEKRRKEMEKIQMVDSTL